VPCSAYGEPGDALADPHLRARGLFGTVADGAGEFVGVNPPWQMSGTRAELRGHVPEIGEQRDEILRDVLNLDAAEIGRLRSAGAFGGAPG
jgi:crotonobetainyl-CoA:carnitine CoA-transferase CaiB-like acyl-CoA transferase